MIEKTVDDKKSTVTQITILYKCGEQNKAFHNAQFGDD